MRRKRLAVVVQRYGVEVAGGSESLARALAERLAVADDVTVFTTCAVDYVTWANHYAPGESTVGGVTVRRFETDRTREIEGFNRLSEDLYAREPGQDEELRWLEEQGPYAPALVEALKREHRAFDAILFFTYLYYPTYWGLKAAPERAVLVPTTHDEPPLRFSLYQEVFSLPRAFAFLTGAEEALVRSRFPLGDRPAWVAGIGIDVEPPPDVEAFRRRHRVAGPYVLYAGRIDAGKGCAEMLDFFARHRQHDPSGPPLLLIGDRLMSIPDGPSVRYLGFVSEEDKRAALAGADVVICSSPYESLSIVLLEALGFGVPVLANARSPVLKDHCVRSNAGLFYDDADEFDEALSVLTSAPALRGRMGERGRSYVREGYAWPVVLERYRRLIDAVASGRAPLAPGVQRSAFS